MSHKPFWENDRLAFERLSRILCQSTAETWDDIFRALDKRQEALTEIVGLYGPVGVCLRKAKDIAKVALASGGAR